MAETRIKYFIQKRTTLKSQLTQLNAILDGQDPDKVNIQYRFNRITELFHAYEGFHDDWCLLKPNDERLSEFKEIQDNYYSLASKVDKTIKAVDRNDLLRRSTSSVSTESSESRHNTFKLPRAEVPKFYGDYDKWPTFKNSFISMIDSHPNLSDVEKFLYLKSALKSDAAGCISCYTVSAENYKHAWQALEKSYEVKRVIVARHLNDILNFPAIEKENHEELIRLVNSARQHVSALETLKIQVGSELVAQIIEAKLPRTLADKWDESLKADELPQFEKLCDFVTAAAVRFAKRQPSKRKPNKHENNGKNAPPIKRSKKEGKDDNVQSFVVNTSTNCVVCKDQLHRLYQCEEFKKMSVPRRLEVVKKAKLCENCLRRHPKKCMWSPCTKCEKMHNTLLHPSKSDKHNKTPAPLDPKRDDSTAEKGDKDDESAPA